MRNEFTAIIERDGDWYIAFCPEIPGANGQGPRRTSGVNWSVAFSPTQPLQAT